MKKVTAVTVLVLGALASAFPACSDVFIAPDGTGTYVGGLPNLSPHGAYVGGTPTVTPDGIYVDGIPKKEKFKKEIRKYKTDK